MTALKPFFLIQSTYKDQPFIHETDLDGMTREQLVAMLAQGQFDTGTLSRVLMIDVANGQALDVSEQIADELQILSHTKGDELSENAEQFIEQFGYSGYHPLPAYTGFLCMYPHRQQDAA